MPNKYLTANFVLTCICASCRGIEWDLLKLRNSYAIMENKIILSSNLTLSSVLYPCFQETTVIAVVIVTE